jgi:hypothetical protein
LDKKEAKRLYDIEYRRINKLKIQERKIIYHAKTGKDRYLKFRENINLEEHRKKHAEYCKSPKYRIYKHRYDRVINAIKDYGEFWESALLTTEIDKEVRELLDKNERLYYLINKDKIIVRNRTKRINNAVEQILNGHADIRILQRGWKKETREYLDDLLTGKYKD